MLPKEKQCIAIIIIVTICLSGCVHYGRPYLNLKAGYLFRPIKYDTGIGTIGKIRVDFMASKAWSQDKIDDFILLSCAKSSLQFGYEYFTITHTKRFWHYSKADIRIHMACYKNKINFGDVIIYDAKKVERKIQNKYEAMAIGTTHW